MNVTNNLSVYFYIAAHKITWIQWGRPAGIFLKAKENLKLKTSGYQELQLFFQGLHPI